MPRFKRPEGNWPVWQEEAQLDVKMGWMLAPNSGTVAVTWTLPLPGTPFPSETVTSKVNVVWEPISGDRHTAVAELWPERNVPAGDGGSIWFQENAMGSPSGSTAEAESPTVPPEMTDSGVAAGPAVIPGGPPQSAG